MPPKRLINATTFQIELRGELEYYGELQNNGQYAIVSHRWTDSEITYTKYTSDGFLADNRHRLANPALISTTAEPGLAKIARACSMAVRDGIPYVWIDTCCINKSPASFPESQQAINSMFQWYKEAAVCYTYLLDVSDEAGEHQEEVRSRDPDIRRNRVGSFVESEWFRRGWTLQELLAPEQLQFYNHRWQSLGTKHDRLPEISDATGIETRFLREDIPDETDGENPQQSGSKIHRRIQKACIATKMSWAARRITTIKDDMAYCLLGLLGQQMETPYGENEKAFLRLQQLLVTKTQDESIFAWTLKEPANIEYGLLAPWVSCFRYSGQLTIRNDKHRQPRGVEGYKIAEEGVVFNLPEKWPNDGQGGTHWNSRNAASRTSYDLGLNCWMKGKESQGSVTIYLRKNKEGQWRRADLGVFKLDDKLKRSFMTKMRVEFSMTVPQYIPHKLPGSDEEGLAGRLADGEVGLGPTPTEPTAASGAVPEQSQSGKSGGLLGRLKIFASKWEKKTILSNGFLYSAGEV